MRSITRRDVEQYIEDRTKLRPPEGIPDASRHTVHKELRALKVALKIAGQPTDAIPDYADGYEPRETYLTREQFDKFLDQLKPHRRLDALYLVWTGARYSEYLRARRSDITSRGVWLRGTKTKDAARVVPLAVTLAAAIEEYDPPESGPMFAPWHSMRRDLRRAAVRAGVPEVSPNDLRRTYCTWLRDAGVDEPTCAALLGHRSSMMVRLVYGRATDERKQRAIAALDAFAGREVVAKMVARKSATKARNDRSVRIKKKRSATRK